MAVRNRKRMARAGLKNKGNNGAVSMARELRRQVRAEKDVQALARRLERALLNRDARLQHLREVIRIFRGEVEQPAAET